MMFNSKWAFLCLGTILAGCNTMQAPADLSTLAGQRAAKLYTPSTEDGIRQLPLMRDFQGKELDLSGYHVTFNDDFDTMSVTDGDGSGPWYAPVHTDFGGAKFYPPRPGKGPVFVRNGDLVIQMQQEDGKWVSTNVQSVNKDGQGFAQKYGYFEMRAKLSKDLGSWGGLWLHSHPALTGPDVPQTEIDIIEAYGGEEKGYRSAIHLWPSKPGLPGDVIKHSTKGSYTKVPDKDGYRTYGALVTPKYIAFYFDRKEVSRIPTPAEFNTPMYILMDMTLLKKLWRKAHGVMEMNVDYVRVWQKNDMNWDNQ